MFMKYFRLYFKFASRSIRTLMEYKMDFLIGLSGFVVSQSLGIILLGVIFQRIPSLNGWNFYEVLFIYAFAQIPRGLDHLYSDNLWIFSRRTIANSEFDRYLLKPINPLFHLLSEKFQTDAFGELITGIVLMVYADFYLKINISFIQILIAVLLIICGALIYTSIKLICASFAFFIRNSGSILQTFYSLSDFAKYSINVYNKVVSSIITFIIPFAFTAYFPAAYFLHKENVVVSVLGTILITCLFCIVSYGVWLKGIDCYEGAGN